MPYYGSSETEVLVACMGPDGKVMKAQWASEYPYILDMLREKFPTDVYDSKTKGAVEVFLVPAALYRTKAPGPWSRKPKPAMCCYRATNRYCQQLLGVGLSSEDEDFYSDHPLMQPEGLPMADTLRVVQETIDPYGLRITRLRVIPGMRVAGDLLRWAEWLGMNPLARGDRCTSNAEFAEQTHQTLEAVDAEFAFEFGETPLKPAVQCDASMDSLMGGGGHAEFIAPRSKVKSFVITYQIGLVERFPWRYGVPQFQPVEELIGKPAEPEQEVDVWAIFNSLPAEEQATLRAAATSKTRQWWVDKRAGAGADVISPPSPPLQLYPGGALESKGPLCRLCHEEIGIKAYGDTCVLCWTALMGDFICQDANKKTHGCGVVFSAEHPVYVAVEHNFTLAVRCAKCNMLFDIPLSGSKPLRIAHNLLRATTGSPVARGRWIRWRDDELQLLPNDPGGPVGVSGDTPNSSPVFD